ncbi:glycogen synthase GlgA [Chthonobacter rhizosphaerae]|uniref:glycogen synthase GlgA n=1 Tax=Chthonobacter rhizosphaerae TaxID=2735553 RepID=UPI0015EEFDE0|nr:glycogen synthase GlgA [Chthonobacter rhizosphaerae]
MNVLFVTSEMAGLAKVGGLGEVSASLPRALQVRGLGVRVLMPAYPSVLASLTARVVVRWLPGLNDVPPCRIEKAVTRGGVPVYLVVCPELYERSGGAYTDQRSAEWVDNDIRFARLGLAAAQVAMDGAEPGWVPDVIHAHDWPTALSLGYLRWFGARLPTVFTVHNLAHQGLFSPERMGSLGIPPEAFGLNGVEFHGRLSFIKSGLFYADHVTTVSPTYAREITGERLGCGLHGLLSGLSDEGRLTGILNGIEDGFPANDNDPDRPARRPNRRHEARNVRTGFCLEPSDGPLFGFVARIDPQKGVDALGEVSRTVVENGGQLAILGEGRPDFERRLVDLAKRFRGRVGAFIGYAEPLAHRVFAGSDFFLMPSRFEPCGLTQMYAQRYGSLPIAYATGGLADTIEDGTTGFLYHDYSPLALKRAVLRAFAAHGEETRLKRMRREAQSRDFSWSASAAAYVDIYRRALARARSGE